MSDSDIALAKIWQGKRAILFVVKTLLKECTMSCSLVFFKVMRLSSGQDWG